MKRNLIYKFFILISLFYSNIDAHKLKENYLQVDFNSSTKTLNINLEVETRVLENVELMDDNKNGIISYKEITHHIDYFTAYIKNHFKLYCNNQILSLDNSKQTLHRYKSQTYLSLNRSYKNIDINKLSLKYDIYFKLEKDHKLIIHLKDNKADVILDDSHRVYNFSSKTMSQMQRLYIFTVEGIKHILSGSDHLLFIFMLLIPNAMLLNGSRQHLKQSMFTLLKIVTAFSVAHSITLFISTMNLYKPDVATIEASIALSILFVSLLNFFGKFRDVNYKISFLFGLLHGFGFANVLEIAGVDNLLSFLTALFGFNLGVEIGQIFIILLIIPILYLASTNRYFPHLIKVVSFISICISLFWFFQRIELF
jgi:hypothetical protein